MIRLINADCLDCLSEMGPVKAIFMDPPDNIGLSYNDYDDNMKGLDYYNWLELVILRSLAKAEIIWISYNPVHDIELKYRVRNILKYRHPSFKAKTFIWRYTFSEYNDHDCSYGYRPILRLSWPTTKLHVDEIRVESERMKLGDKRAAGPRVPDNCFEYPRVVGNSKERRAWHPTQHPEGLMERIIKLSCSDKEEFVDLFAGTGTSLRVCNRLGIRNTSFEISKQYCEQIAKENKVPFWSPDSGTENPVTATGPSRFS